MSVYRYNSTQVCLYVFTFKMQLIGTFPKIFSMTPKGKCKWRGVTIEKVKDVFLLHQVVEPCLSGELLQCNG